MSNIVIEKLKKPRTSFILFCNDHRDKCKIENPNLQSKDINVLLAKMWNQHKTSNSEIVEKYKVLSRNDINRYLADKSKTSPTETTAKKFRPFELFVKDELIKIRQHTPSTRKKDVLADCKKKWKELVKNKDPLVLHYKNFKSIANSQSKDLVVSKDNEEPLNVENNEINNNGSSNVHDDFEDFETYCKKYRPKYKELHTDLEPKKITKHLFKMFKNREIPNV